jgi:hypothetical protein
MYEATRFRSHFFRTFTCTRKRTYVAVKRRKQLLVCVGRKVRPDAKYVFQVTPTMLLIVRVALLSRLLQQL